MGAGSVTVKFPIKRTEATHWVLEVNPSSFHTLIGLRWLVVGWSKVKLAEHLRAIQCYKCNKYGHISGHCKIERYALIAVRISIKVIAMKHGRNMVLLEIRKLKRQINYG